MAPAQVGHGILEVPFNAIDGSGEGFGSLFVRCMCCGNDLSSTLQNDPHMDGQGVQIDPFVRHQRGRHMELCLPKEKATGIADKHLRIVISGSPEDVWEPFAKVCC